jgi:molybdenum cofactor synthesis domain-containing protein
MVRFSAGSRLLQRASRWSVASPKHLFRTLKILLKPHVSGSANELSKRRGGWLERVPGSRYVFWDIITAAVLVIGDEILSGRTKDKNIGYIADYLTAIGIDLKEVRVVADEAAAIVDALNALRAKYTYVFTTGGIGPTHDDITADCVAAAFGVALEFHPEAIAILKARLAKTGGELNEARLRMARIPKGAALVANKVSGAPGFWIGNVITMAGIPAVMQAMLDEVAPKLKTGTKLLSETIRADAKEGDVGTELGAIAKAHPSTIIGSYPFIDEKNGPNTNIVVRSRDAGELAVVKAEVEGMLKKVKAQLPPAR